MKTLAYCALGVELLLGGTSLCGGFGGPEETPAPPAVKPTNTDSPKTSDAANKAALSRSGPTESTKPKEAPSGDSSQSQAAQSTVKPSPAQEAVVAELKKRGVTVDRDREGQVYRVISDKAQLSDDDLPRLSVFTALEILELSGPGITDAGLAHLRELASLKKLYLHDCPITDKGLENLAALKQLNVLSLQRTKLEGPGLAHLKGLSHLEAINLSETDVGNAALAILGGIPTLTTVILEKTKVTDEGLAHLKPLKALRKLSLNDCKITSKSFIHLHEHYDLRMLYVYGCEVDDDDVEELKNEVAGLAVYYD